MDVKVEVRMVYWMHLDFTESLICKNLERVSRVWMKGSMSRRASVLNRLSFPPVLLRATKVPPHLFIWVELWILRRGWIPSPSGKGGPRECRLAGGPGGLGNSRHRKGSRPVHGGRAHMHRRVFLGLAALASVPSLLGGQSLAVGTETGIDTRSIDSFVERELARSGIPGLALAIVHQDQVIYVRGYGRADPTGRSVTPETLFCLGSVSKSFTALAVMQLIEEGRLELDTPVQQIIPWFRTAAPELSGRITVRHLLNHTSGLSTRAGRVHLARHLDRAP